MKILALAFLIPSLALATVKPETPKVETPPTATSTSASNSVSNAKAASNSVSVASSQSNSYSNSASSSNSNSGGNSLTVNESNPRQTPGMAQGSFAIQGCQVAGNAGGSQVGGTGFLGFGFTPAQCYDYMLAQAYAALGEKQAACLVLNSTKAAKRAEKRGVRLPTCTRTQPPVPTQSASTAPQESVPRETSCATKTELRETVDRAFRCKQEQGK